MVRRTSMAYFLVRPAHQMRSDTYNFQGFTSTIRAARIDCEALAERRIVARRRGFKK